LIDWNSDNISGLKPVMRILQQIAVDCTVVQYDVRHRRYTIAGMQASPKIQMGVIRKNESPITLR